MKKITIFFFLLPFLVFAQTGPGGVGSSSTNLVWLDAENEIYNNNDPVSSWTDISGNSNNADQGTSSFRPVFKTGQINGRPAIQFDGSNDRLTFLSNITTSATSTFIVYRSTGNSNNAIICMNKHLVFSSTNNATATYFSPQAFYNVTQTDNTYGVFSLHTGSATTGASLRLLSNTNSNVTTRNALGNKSASSLGARVDGGGVYGRFFQGFIAEVAVFNFELNTAQRRILTNSLGSKYGISLVNYYTFGSSYGSDIIGIGKESDGSNSSARGAGVVQISNASSLDNGDYLFVGHDNAGFSASTSVPTGVQERWTQVWRSGVKSSPGTVSMEFFLESNALNGSTNDYVLLIDDDGDFTNGGTTQHTTGLSYDAIDNSISFTNVSLSNGSYFTLAIKNGTATSITDGSWKNRSTWDCDCIPDETYNVTVASPFEVILDSNARALSLTVEDGAILMFGIEDTLDIELDFTNNGNVDFDGAGTLMASGSSSQEFVNNSDSPIEIHNLYVNNTGDGLNITTGGWTITNNLQVLNGGLDVTGTDSVVLVSDASKTSQILESMSNAFAGTFKIERYISNRNTDFSCIASPLQSATFADLDDEIYMSGIGGNDGNAQDVNGGIFYSAYGYIRSTQTYDTITSTAEVMVPGEGYEIYLGTSSATYTQGGFSFEGVPNSGDITPSPVEQGFNLAGNPYHSFIDFDQTDKSNIDDVYYIFDASTGSYATFSGGSKPPIASGQAFWVNKSTPGSASYNFEESDKVDSTSSAFVRMKSSKEYSILLKNSENQLHHEFSVKLNSAASKERDQFDIVHLPSPYKHIPQLYSNAENSSTNLSTNALNLFDQSQVIPLSVSSKSDVELMLETENFDALSQEYSCMYLKDKSENKIIDLNFEKEYSFKTDGNENRFELILSNSYGDCEKLIESDNFSQDIDYQMSLRNSNGTYYLDYQLSNELHTISIGLYNLNGQLVRNEIQITTSGEGFYRLNDLNDLEGIYLIQVKGKDLFLNKTIKL